jgi:hypothetical protein
MKVGMGWTRYEPRRLLLGVPATLGIGIVIQQLHLAKNRRAGYENSN